MFTGPVFVDVSGAGKYIGYLLPIHTARALWLEADAAGCVEAAGCKRRAAEARRRKRALRRPPFERRVNWPSGRGGENHFTRAGQGDVAGYETAGAAKKPVWENNPLLRTYVCNTIC